MKSVNHPMSTCIKSRTDTGTLELTPANQDARASLCLCPWGVRAFVETYQAALEGAPNQVVGRSKAGTIAALVQLYLASRQWKALASQSQRTYRHILDHFVAEHRQRLVNQMEARHVDKIIAAKAETPAAANKLRKLLSLLMRVAIWKVGARTIP